jgi:hypothetical protein
MKEKLRHVDVASFAVMIAKVLRERFPAAQFRVTVGRPIQSSLHVQWTDGPTKNLVTDVLAGFLAQAETVQQSIHVKTDREISMRFAERLVAQIAHYYGVDAPEVVVSNSSLGWALEGGSNVPVSWETMIDEASEDATRFSRLCQLAEYNANSLTDRLMKEIIAS